jgi:flagellar capping protein FliD
MNVTSNYINSLNSVKRYDYAAMKSRTTGSAYTPIHYGSTQSGGYYNSEAVGRLTSIQSGAKALAGSVDEAAKASTYNKMNPTSSDKASLTVSSGSTPSAAFGEKLVDIKQVASGQINSGAQLKGDALYAGGQGTQQLELEIEGKKTQISFEVKSGDTNKAVQQKISAAINAKNLGVTAEVGSHNGQTTLTVKSKGTGDSDKNRFVLRDMYGSAAETLGIDRTSQAAQNAIYSINGGADIHSSANSVDLGDGVKATLNKATGENPVTVKVTRDADHAVNSVKELVKNYNSLLETSRSTTNYNDRLYNDLTNAAQSYAKSLASVGVTINKDKSLSVDEKALTASAEMKNGGSSALEGFMTNYGSRVNSYGFAGRLSTVASNVEKNPAAYINKSKSATTTEQAGSSAAGITWSDPFESSENNPYAQYTAYTPQSYDRYLTLGYLFDMFV